MKAAICIDFTNDADTYTGLVEPYRENRKLSDLTHRLLTSYYYNPKVRDLVDGGVVSFNDGSSTSDALTEVKKTLGRLGALTDMANTLFSNGITEMKGYAAGTLDDDSVGSMHKAVERDVKALTLNKALDTLSKEQVSAPVPPTSDDGLKTLSERVDNLDSKINLVLSLLQGKQASAPAATAPVQVPDTPLVEDEGKPLTDSELNDILSICYEG